MKHRLVTLVLSIAVIASLLVIGCAPEVAPPPEEEAPPPEEEEEVPPPAAPEEEVFKLVYQLSAPIGTPYGDDVKAFAEDVYKASSGRLDIAVKSGGEIVPSHEVTDAISKGVLDMGHPNAAMDVGRFGPVAFLFGCSGFPAGPNPIEYLAWFYEGGGRERVNEIYQGQYDVVIIAQVTDYPAELLCHSSKKITKISDFKGLKFRTMGPWAEVMESFGASIVTVPGGEIYECAQRGVVDAFEYCGAAIDWTMGFHEITKYIGVPGIHSPMSSNLLMINKDKWDALPDDLKEILRLAGEAHSIRDYLDVSTRDAFALDKYREYGTEIFVLPDEVQQAIVERSEEFVKKHCEEDALYKEIYEGQLEFIKKWRSRADICQPKYSLYTD